MHLSDDSILKSLTSGLHSPASDVHLSDDSDDGVLTAADRCTDTGTGGTTAVANTNTSTSTNTVLSPQVRHHQSAVSSNNLNVTSTSRDIRQVVHALATVLRAITPTRTSDKVKPDTIKDEEQNKPMDVRELIFYTEKTCGIHRSSFTNNTHKLIISNFFALSMQQEAITYFNSVADAGGSDNSLDGAVYEEYISRLLRTGDTYTALYAIQLLEKKHGLLNLPEVELPGSTAATLTAAAGSDIDKEKDEDGIDESKIAQAQALDNRVNINKNSNIGRNEDRRFAGRGFGEKRVGVDVDVDSERALDELMRVGSQQFNRAVESAVTSGADESDELDHIIDKQLSEEENSGSRRTISGLGGGGVEVMATPPDLRLLYSNLYGKVMNVYRLGNRTNDAKDLVCYIWGDMCACVYVCLRVYVSHPFPFIPHLTIHILTSLTITGACHPREESDSGSQPSAYVNGPGIKSK